jgi:hypothetical protein
MPVAKHTVIGVPEVEIGSVRAGDDQHAGTVLLEDRQRKRLRKSSRRATHQNRPDARLYCSKLGREVRPAEMAAI